MEIESAVPYATTRKSRKRYGFGGRLAILIVSTLGTLLSLSIGVVAIYELSGNIAMSIQSWAWFVTAQMMYTTVVWMGVYACSRRPDYPWVWRMHPDAYHLLAHFLNATIQTTMFWLLFARLSDTQRVLFDNNRYEEPKPSGYSTDTNAFWFALMVWMTSSIVTSTVALAKGIALRVI